MAPATKFPKPVTNPTTLGPKITVIPSEAKPLPPPKPKGQ